MTVVKFLSLDEVGYGSWNLTVPFLCVHGATAEQFKQKKPPSKIPGPHDYDCLAAVDFEVKYT